LIQSRLVADDHADLPQVVRHAGCGYFDHPFDRLAPADQNAGDCAVTRFKWLDCLLGGESEIRADRFVPQLIDVELAGIHIALDCLLPRLIPLARHLKRSDELILRKFARRQLRQRFSKSSDGPVDQLQETNDHAQRGATVPGDQNFRRIVCGSKSLPDSFHAAG